MRPEIPDIADVELMKETTRHNDIYPGSLRFNPVQFIPLQVPELYTYMQHIVLEHMDLDLLKFKVCMLRVLADTHRPRLMTQTDRDDDYINAVFVDVSIHLVVTFISPNPLLEFRLYNEA